MSQAFADQNPLRWRDGALAAVSRSIPTETPVAITVNGSSHAVMLASPSDLADFARGFALTEQLIESTTDIEGIEVVAQPGGIEVRLWLCLARAEAAAQHRRRLTGPTGCGLCGVESLEAALPPVRLVTGAGPHPTPDEILSAMAALTDAQPLGTITRAVHAAALWRRGEPLIVREDVGRHNALDKLIGATIGRPTDDAMLLLTSRVSVEMVTKAAVLGALVLVAVSAPTTLAVDAARAAGLTLVAVARADGFEVFTAPERIAFAEDSR